MQNSKAIDPLEPKELHRLSAELRDLATSLLAREEARAPTEGISAGFVRSIIRARRLRQRYLGRDLFADPAWDMMLDLYAARLETQTVSVSSLGLAAAVPSTTALRWSHTLEERGIVRRSTDPKDGRRIFLSLTEESAAAMEALLLEMRATSATII